ncbi:5'-nucleotidase (lipoprotein e(P4) family) [Filimonas zeae]|uniref:5'-nucleotidase n=1 Tax=Filimonas zeae TaxID=1737353 RepID=A0A917MWB3_9BACT|nr:5'-nucleotidase, lipoprotein e(P4) family [Filimonas zeae]MDR6338566.1 5'-nucleotidase (lipoprotein e(P4) family) [Filimonas zeae]GGH67633.1 5'-nucleotidase [Filimonas zeae]
MKLNAGILAGLLLCSCASQKPQATATAESKLVPDGKLWASLFQQRAAEYKALCLQAYNIAQLRLEQAIRQRTNGKPLAVVTDVDETFLDNSPYDVKQALAGKDYENNSWQQWTSLGQADSLPGALRFFKYAADNQVTVFYITNRGEAERAGTTQNLLKYGFPFADNNHIILKQPGSPSSKESRRQDVLKNYDIVLLLGDNLADFSTLFDSKSEEERAANVLSSAAEFGNRFIVLPNPVYGDWESSFFKHEPRFTAAQKDSVIRARLKTY